MKLPFVRFPNNFLRHIHREMVLCSDFDNIFKFSTFAFPCLNSKYRVINLTIAQRDRYIPNGVKKHIPFAHRRRLLFSIPMKKQITCPRARILRGFPRTAHICWQLFVSVDVAFIHELCLDFWILFASSVVFPWKTDANWLQHLSADNCLSIWT